LHISHKIVSRRLTVEPDAGKPISTRAVLGWLANTRSVLLAMTLHNTGDYHCRM